MFETKSKKINGIEFKVSQFSAITALKLKTKLVRLFGPALGQAFGSVGKSESGSLLDTRLDPAGIAKAVESLFHQLDENGVVALAKEMLASTSCTASLEGSEVHVSFANDFDNTFNIVFTGRILTLYPLLYFVLEVNYPDFFDKVGDFGNRVQTVLSQQVSAKETKSPTA